MAIAEKGGTEPAGRYEVSTAEEVHQMIKDAGACFIYVTGPDIPQLRPGWVQIQLIGRGNAPAGIGKARASALREYKGKAAQIIWP